MRELPKGWDSLDKLMCCVAGQAWVLLEIYGAEWSTVEEFVHVQDRYDDREQFDHDSICTAIFADGSLLVETRGGSDVYLDWRKHVEDGIFPRYDAKSRIPGPEYFLLMVYFHYDSRKLSDALNDNGSKFND